MDLKALDQSAKEYIVEQYWLDIYGPGDNLERFLGVDTESLSEEESHLAKIYVLFRYVFNYTKKDMDTLPEADGGMYDELLTLINEESGFVDLCIGGAKTIHIFAGKLQTLH